jgi:hypothetical protein
MALEGEEAFIFLEFKIKCLKYRRNVEFAGTVEEKEDEAVKVTILLICL